MQEPLNYFFLAEEEESTHRPLYSPPLLPPPQVGGDGPSMGSSSRAMKATMRSLAVIAVPLTMHESAGLFVYWFTNNFFSVTQVGLDHEPLSFRPWI